MRRTFNFIERRSCVLLSTIAAASVILWAGCQHDQPTDPTAAAALAKQRLALAQEGMRSASQVNLVADDASFSPDHVDANLQNAWGIAINPNGKVWISANRSGVSVVYDEAGNTVRPPVSIPTKDSSTGGAPTGIVFNSAGSFVIPGTGDTSRFIFSTADGLIAAWSSGSKATVVANHSAMKASYTGLTLAWDGGRPFLYAANFAAGKVDVFDDHFQSDTTKVFQDPNIPSGFAPFNVQSIDGVLFVTFAKQGGTGMLDQPGPGNGFVDVFDPSGMLLQRFASGGALNSPWGVAKVPDDGSGRFEKAVVVGNFGDGRISVFSRHGRFIGSLVDSSGNSIAIDGLWALTFGRGQGEANDESGDGTRFMLPADDGGDGGGGGGDGGGDHGGGGDQGGDGHQNGNGDDHGDHGNHAAKILPRLFFTAGPHGGSDGIFGYVRISR